jgi:hypothetical protein
VPYIECTLRYVNPGLLAALTCSGRFATRAVAVRTRSLLLAAALLGACRTPPAPPAAAPSPDVDNERDAWARSQGLVLKKLDSNRDGRPDVFAYFRVEPDPHGAAPAERLVRKDTDLNHDGRVDVVELFDADGKLAEVRSDLDFDGRVDEIAYFRGGRLTRQELDLDFDGHPDVVKYYEDDKLVRIESDRNGDGKIDTWEYFEGGRLDRVGVDTDLDGTVDRWDKRQEDTPAAPPAGQAKAAPPR